MFTYPQEKCRKSWNSPQQFQKSPNNTFKYATGSDRTPALLRLSHNSRGAVAS